MHPSLNATGSALSHGFSDLPKASNKGEIKSHPVSKIPQTEQFPGIQQSPLNECSITPLPGTTIPGLSPHKDLPTDFSHRFQSMCDSTNTDSGGLLPLLAGINPEEINTWLKSPLGVGPNPLNTPVVYAARRGKADLVDELITLGADPVAANPHVEDKSCALFIAAQEDHANVIEVICGKHQINPNVPRLSDDFTPLDMAVHRNHIEAARALLKYQADPNMGLQFSQGKSVKLLTEAPSPSRTYTHTPVYRAVENMRAEMLQLLLEHGGSVENPDPDKLHRDSPLGRAVLKGQEPTEDENNVLKIIRCLLEHGANIHAPYSFNDITVFQPDQINIRPTIAEILCHASTSDMPPYRPDRVQPILNLLYEYRTGADESLSISDFCNTHASVLHLKILQMLYNGQMIM